MILPKTIVKAEHDNPRKMMIFSNPKVGKTSLLAGLPNNLIIDLENGTGFVDALKVKANSLADLRAIADAITKANQECKGFAYEYITLDTITALEDLCKSLALQLYQQTPMGAKYKGDILSLPNGGGYHYLRLAFERVYSIFENLSKCLILSGHIKNASINKDDKEVTSRDIDLTGKIKRITAQNVDAIGYLYRKNNQCILSFKTSEEDLATGARPKHLRNQEIVVSEMCDEDNLVTYWDRIFLNN